MFTVENQKVVKINSVKADTFGIVGNEAASEAMRTLKANTFKLWFYMAKNKDGWKFALSRVDACKYCGFSKNTYHAAVNELIENGYLVQTAEGSNQYDFYEVPQGDYEVIDITVHKDTATSFEEFVF